MKKKELGEKIRELRHEKSMSMTELAALAGVSITTVHVIETGKGNPNKTTLKCILDVLGVKLEELMEYENGTG